MVIRTERRTTGAICKWVDRIVGFLTCKNIFPVLCVFEEIVFGEGKHCICRTGWDIHHGDESDTHPLSPCPVCLRKMHWSIGFDPVKRERELGEVYQRLGITERPLME